MMLTFQNQLDKICSASHTKSRQTYARMHFKVIEMVVTWKHEWWVMAIALLPNTWQGMHQQKLWTRLLLLWCLLTHQMCHWWVWPILIICWRLSATHDWWLSVIGSYLLKYMVGIFNIIEENWVDKRNTNLSTYSGMMEISLNTIGTSQTCQQFRTFKVMQLLLSFWTSNRMLLQGIEHYIINLLSII